MFLAYMYMHNTQEAYDIGQEDIRTMTWNLNIADSPDMMIRYNNMYDLYNYCINDNTMTDT